MEKERITDEVELPSERPEDDPEDVDEGSDEERETVDPNAGAGVGQVPG